MDLVEKNHIKNHSWQQFAFFKFRRKVLFCLFFLSLKRTTNCPERDIIFTSAGIAGTVTLSLATFPLGFILDNYGSFWCRTISSILLSGGLVLLGLVPKFQFLLYPAAILVSSSSYALVVTNFSLAQETSSQIFIWNNEARKYVISKFLIKLYVKIARIWPSWKVLTRYGILEVFFYSLTGRQNF